MTDRVGKNVLVVDDRDQICALVRVAATRQHWAAHSVNSLSHALEKVRSGGPWRAVFVKEHLPAGSGLGLVARARVLGCHAPVLLQTDRLEGKAIDTVFDLGVVAVLECVTVQRVECFLRRAEQGDARLIATSRLVASRYRLTESERDILTRSASGEDRAAIALERASQVATVNKHIGQLLRKMGCDSLLAAVTKLVSWSFLLPDVQHLPQNAHSKEWSGATPCTTTQRSTTRLREAAPRLDLRHDAIHRARSFS